LILFQKLLFGSQKKKNERNRVTIFPINSG
jgi:hypothetical protein